MFMIPWVYLVESPNIYDVFYHFKFGIPSFFRYVVPVRENARKLLNVLLLMYFSVEETLANRGC